MPTKTTFPRQFINTPELIYRWANDRYWDNQLPNDIRVEYADISEHQHVKIKGHGRPAHTITLKQSLSDCPESLLNALVHSQIHLWQYVTSLKENNPEYLDKTTEDWANCFSEFKGRTKAFHGLHFHSQMDRLNDKFNELSLSLTHEPGEESLLLEDPVFLMHVTGRTNNGMSGHALYWCSKPFSKESRNQLHQWAENSPNLSSVLDVRFGITTNQDVKQYSRLNNSGLPKSFEQVHVRHQRIEKLMAHIEETQWESQAKSATKIELTGVTAR